jgi:hypothetical protein
MWHAWESRKSVQGFGEKRDHLEDQGVDGRMGSEWLLGRLAGGGGVNWIDLPQDRDLWQAVVNAGMKIRVLEPWS